MSDHREQLVAMRAEALRRAASLSKSFEGIVEAARDVATDDEHDPEGHTIAWERQQVSALLDDTRASLVEIEAAQERLDDGSYGVCVRCGDPIAPARLEALPATPKCVSCAV